MKTKEFPLAVVLSVTTGRKFVPFVFVHDLLNFMVRNRNSTTDERIFYPYCREDLLEQFHFLKEVNPPASYREERKWLQEQKARFGGKLIVKSLGLRGRKIEKNT